MKIVLVRPPYYAVLGSEEKIGNIPLGLCYISAILEQHGHEVEILDCESLDLTEREDSGKAEAFLKWNTAYPIVEKIMSDPKHPVWNIIADEIIEMNPDLIGFTSYTQTMTFVNYVSRKIKSKCDIPVMLGGPHPTSLPDLSLQESNADFVVLGEGENAVLELISDLQKNTQKKLYYGIAADLNKIPLPARHLLNKENYYKEAFGYIITSRGCPYNCIFCASHTLWGKKIRLRSIDSIVNEIIKVQNEHDLDVFRFADDLFPINYKRVRSFADELERRNCKISFRCGSRVDTISWDILLALKDAGCNEISFGIESGSQRILDLIDKGTTLKQIKRAVELTKKAGIRAIVYFMIGHPTETLSDVNDSISLIDELDADRTLLNLVTTLPGTKLVDYVNEDISKDWWKYYFQGKVIHSISDIKYEDLDVYFRKMCEWVALKNTGNNPEKIILWGRKDE